MSKLSDNKDKILQGYADWRKCYSPASAEENFYDFTEELTRKELYDFFELLIYEGGYL